MQGSITATSSNAFGVHTNGCHPGKAKQNKQSGAQRTQRHGIATSPYMLCSGKTQTAEGAAVNPDQLRYATDTVHVLLKHLRILQQFRTLLMVSLMACMVA